MSTSPLGLAEWLEQYLDQLTIPEAVDYAIECIYQDKNRRAAYLDEETLQRLRAAASRARERTKPNPASTSPARDDGTSGSGPATEQAC